MSGFFDELILPVENFTFTLMKNPVDKWENQSRDFAITYFRKFQGHKRVFTYQFLNSIVRQRLIGRGIYTDDDHFNSLIACKREALKTLKSVSHAYEWKQVDPTLKKKYSQIYNVISPQYQHAISPLMITGHSGSWEFSFIEDSLKRCLGKNIDLKTNFTTRLKALQYLRSLLANNLELFYDHEQYQAFKNIQFDYIGEQQNNTPTKYWWCYFLRPEIDISSVLGKTDKVEV